jgi:hypothetical protein
MTGEPAMTMEMLTALADAGYITVAEYLAERARLLAEQ